MLLNNHLAQSSNLLMHRHPMFAYLKDFSARAIRSYIKNALTSGQVGCLKFNDIDNTSIIAGNIDSELKVNFKVLDEKFYSRCFWWGSNGFAESYLRKEWECDNLFKTICYFILNFQNSSLLDNNPNDKLLINLFKPINKLLHFNKENTIAGAKKNIAYHYDLGNDFFKTFLDRSLTYSSAIFTNENENLENAQINKYENIIKKLNLKPTHHILEIGSGWGGFSIYLAQKYGCRITTTTISKEQYKYVSATIKAQDLTDKINVVLQDYRNLTGLYDRIVSIEMIEAVGDKYYEAFFATCSKLLTLDGILILQMILCPDSRYELVKNNLDFIQKYIFPGSLIPSLHRINQATKKISDLNLYNLEDIGISYAKTLELWQQNFNHSLKTIDQLGFDERFVRMWNYYLSYCMAAFATKNINCVQAVYSRPNNLNLSTYFPKL